MDVKSRAAIIGVTGFIGHGLPEMLMAQGMASTGISRSGGGDVPGVDRWQTPEMWKFAGYHDAVINLAGAPINQRWTKENRRRIRESRVDVTKRLVESIATLPPEARPRVLVNGSAVGFYGDRGEEVLTEASHAGEGFLAEVCRDWEAAAKEAEALGVRVVLLRTAMVLGEGGMAFKQLRRVFRSGLGGKLGSGKQWMPWIHLADLRAAIVHAVFSESLSGPINGCAPHVERNRDFTRKFAAAAHRPAILPVPGFAVKLVLGGFGGALLSSQHVRPAALEADGFDFRYPTLESALDNLLW